MSETWPIAVLPNPSVNFSGEVQPATVRTEMESGRTRQRARFDSQKRTYPVVWQMSDFQYGLFQSFVKYKLTNGVDAFYIDLPVGAGTNSLQTVLATMVNGAYKGVYDDVMYWNVSATLEVNAITLYTEAELDAFIAAGVTAPITDTQAFIVPLIEGEITKVITFPSLFVSAPPGLKLQLVVPVDGFDFGIDLVGGTLTAAGFTASFGAAVPGPGYSISIIASFTIP
jgi:hypothetical protein